LLLSQGGDFGDAGSPQQEDFGQMDVEAAEHLYEALRAVREKHR